jgi:hypothetical protein
MAPGEQEFGMAIAVFKTVPDSSRMEANGSSNAGSNPGVSA